jgi:hypothetical protein
MPLIFQFSKNLGGRIICTESLCPNNPIYSFLYDEQLYLTMFHPEATIEPPINEDLVDMKPLNNSIRKPIKKLNEKFDK